MATKPELRRAVANAYIKASDYNYNFEQLNNYIENGVADNAINNYEADREYSKGQWVLANTSEGKGLYESKVDGNKGNSLLDTTYWKKLVLGGTLNLFDTVLKDHILTYEESKGLALLGTYVYKEAVAGSRYGYPDFYNKAVAEREAGTPTETTLGENTVTMYVNPNGHILYDIADKDAVDAWYDTYGIAWFYGVDTINERICLPRGQNYLAQGNNNAISVDIFGNGNALGITTDLTKDGYAYHNTASGSGLYPKTYTTSTNPPVVGSTAGSGDQTTTSRFAGITTDPTKSGLVGTVDLSNTGQKAYIYMCVGNTETTSTITDVVDVTTTENDTIPLFTGMYFDFTPNNVSWLKAGEQKNSGGIYETAYNELVKALTTSREASTFSTNQVTKNITPTIVGTVNDDPIETQAYYFSENDYLSTTLEVGSDPFELQFEFRTLADVTTSQIVASTEYAEITLAISNGRFYYYNYGEEIFAQCLPSTTYTCAFGRANGMTYYKVSTDNGDTWTTQDYAYPLGDTTVTLNFGKPNGNTEKGANPFTGVIDLTSFVLTSTETQENTPTNIIFDGKVINIDDMQDGVDYSEYWKVDVNAEAFTTPTAIGQESTGELYFKVANAVQNLELLDAGYILENMVDKTNLSEVSVCIEEYVNGTSGYRIYSDIGNGKYCEQWGIVTTSGDNYIAFLKKYKDENFIVSFQRRYIGEGTKKSDTGTANKNTIAGSTQYGVINGEGMYITVQSENGCTGVVWHTKGYLA